MILLCGRTASGKNTIRDEIVKLGVKPIVTYTTRPMRKGEIDGVTYHFITNDDFLGKESEGFFAETTSYNVATGDIWHYGTAKEDLSGGRVLIVNPDGLKAIKDMKDIKTTSFLIYADEETIWNRLMQRGDSEKEAKRRLQADNEDFKDINDYIDFFIRNEDCDPKEVANLIIYLIEINNRGGEFQHELHWYKPFIGKRIKE